MKQHLLIRCRILFGLHVRVSALAAKLIHAVGNFFVTPSEDYLTQVRKECLCVKSAARGPLHVFALYFMA
jgi:hypothetical protein